HTGVSSPERGEPPYPERYCVPASTARLVNAVRGWGGRIVAVGTTVVRALETVAEPDGAVVPGEGWTNLVVTPARGLRAVDGLLTGWHEPEASHLQMLRAAAPDELLDRSYQAALEHGYHLWEAPDNVSMAAVALAISGGGALSSLETTVLLTVDETMDALRKAEHVQYRTPGA